jgi:ABC-type enterobactin transport system permease subunit
MGHPALAELPTWVTAIRNASHSDGKATMGWKLPLLIIVWSVGEANGLSSAAFSSTVVASPGGRDVLAKRPVDLGV